MKFTTLYVHDSTACWMQWRGSRLVQVYCESITRELAKQATACTEKDSIQSLCPWLNGQASQVRLLIDPVADQSRIIPAFDYGFVDPHGVLDQFRQTAEQVYLTCRSLTSDVLTDDLARYRHERLKHHPNGLLQWHKLKSSSSKTEQSRLPRHWLVSDSGLSDYVLSWLHSMANNGLEFIDVNTVCSLFAKQDAHCQCPVVTVWVQQNRCRLIQTDSGFVIKVEQWNNTVEARLALEEMVSVLRDEGRPVLLRYIGKDEDLCLWQEAIPNANMEKRNDGIGDVASYPKHLDDVLPEACLNLPLTALVRKYRSFELGMWSDNPYWETGASLNELLSIARWKKRYKQTVVATTLTATFSGYFVLLACMHAVELIELHQRARAELVSLESKHSTLKEEIHTLTSDPDEAVESVKRLDATENLLATEEQDFLQFIVQALKKRTDISILSVSWRILNDSRQEPNLMDEVVKLTELRSESLQTLQPSHMKGDKYRDERLLIISGTIDLDSEQSLSYQQSSEALIAFFNTLSEHEKVKEILSLKDIATDTPMMNLPSDALTSQHHLNGFVVAVRVSV